MTVDLSDLNRHLALHFSSLREPYCIIQDWRQPWCASLSHRVAPNARRIKLVRFNHVFRPCPCVLSKLLSVQVVQLDAQVCQSKHSLPSVSKSVSKLSNELDAHRVTGEIGHTMDKIERRRAIQKVKKKPPTR